VDGVGFHIAPGETYGLLGPNGAGKTTTISMAVGLLERDAGEKAQRRGA
jgi:ABC-2 type transport system ATP-binding protein